MTVDDKPALTTVATFPEHYFLENIAVRADGSMLVTALNRRELWWVPAPAEDATIGAVLVDRLDGLPMSIVEAEPDVFYVSSMGPATLDRYDLRGWSPGAPVNRTRTLSFPSQAAGLNGSALLAPGVILIADCAAGLIWRVDLTEDGLAGKAGVWLKHNTMAPGEDADKAVHLTQTFSIPYPGVNGVRVGEKSGYVFYTGSWEQVFVRVAVDPVTHQPAGEPEVVTKGIHAADDFCVDENAGVAYITTHIDNTLWRVPLDPAVAATESEMIIGEPIDHRFLGPSSAAWGRQNGDHGRVAYFTTDGGHTPPNPAGLIKPSAVVRVEFQRKPEVGDVQHQLH